MASAKITALTALTAAAGVDLLAIVDDPAGSPITKKITYANLIASFSAIGQLPFPATQVPSADANTLDDYEEGTWTPVLTFATPGDLAVVYSTQVGRYTKIGNRVYFDFFVTTTTFTHTTALSDLRLSGLPIAVAAGAATIGESFVAPWTKATYTQIAFLAAGGQVYGNFQAIGSGVAASTLIYTNLPTATNLTIRGQGHYTI